MSRGGEKEMKHTLAFHAEGKKRNAWAGLQSPEALDDQNFKAVYF